VKRELERSRDIALGGTRDIPEYSAPEVVRLAAARLTEREAVLGRARLLDQSVLASGGRHGVRELNLAIDGGAEEVQRLGEDAKGREYYTTVEMRRLEARNLDTMRKLGEFRTLVSREEVARYRKTWEEARGVRLTDGQIGQGENELLGTRGVLATVGKPGTGKTLASGFIEDFNAEVLQPQGRCHCTLNVAYTRKAALEMERASGRPGFTVDGFPNAFASGQVRLQGEEPACQVNMSQVNKNSVFAARQIVLRPDEASLVHLKAAAGSPSSRERVFETVVSG
jgi:hypothetical protein